MGIPALFAWLTRRYAGLVRHVVEALPTGDEHHSDRTLPNPDLIETDYLYLDMNGIIHPCTHPEDKAPPANEDEAMMEIFRYIDRIMSIVRPRQLLYMAIDGVAPRAKMNQQRSRRFRAGKEAAIDEGSSSLSSSFSSSSAAVGGKETEISAADSEILLDAPPVPVPPPAVAAAATTTTTTATATATAATATTTSPAAEKPTKFDSNVITPGTPFMARLALGLRYYVLSRMNSEKHWKPLKVILSDASVPGEGEHKIMDFIRRQRNKEKYNPYIRHCLYGLDADLIMLALATHEPYFVVLREDVFNAGVSSRNRERGVVSSLSSELSNYVPPEQTNKKSYIWFSVMLLRQYLARELLPAMQCSFRLQPENAIDDWVFFCYMVGNDFLPHLPSLDVREGGVDVLIDIYRRILPEMGGYLTNRGVLNLSRVQILLRELGRQEAEYFQRQSWKQQGRKRRRLENGAPALEDEAADVVRLGEPGYKDRYYTSKFLHDPDFAPMFGENNDWTPVAEALTYHYLCGLSWVLRYYYQGCPSWSWYYPSHYAPFASDFKDIGGIVVQFEKDEPFRPLEQLMAVFPPSSGSSIPEVYRRFMTDPDSPLLHFYPEDFEIDLNGKRALWQGVALLPFVDGKLLQKTLRAEEHHLTAEEKKRNSFGTDVLFAGPTCPLRRMIRMLNDADRKSRMDWDPAEYGGFGGELMAEVKEKDKEKDKDNEKGDKGEEEEDSREELALTIGQTIRSPLAQVLLPDVEDNQVLSARYFN